MCCNLRWYYHWAGMKRDVANWVAGYPTFQLVMPKHQVPSGLPKQFTYSRVEIGRGYDRLGNRITSH